MSSRALCIVVLILGVIILLLLCNKNSSCSCKGEGFINHEVCSNKDGGMPTSCAGTSPCSYNNGLTEYSDFDKTMPRGWTAENVHP